MDIRPVGAALLVRDGGQTDGQDEAFKLFPKSMRTKLKTKLRGFSPRANHTDRAAAAGRRS